MNSSNAEISIVLPVFNRAEIVGRTLLSIETQTARPLNVILVDNNSTDNSVAVLKAWKERVESSDFRVTIVSESTPGATAARNRGLQEVKTDWVMFFDSDDIMLPTHVERAMRIISRNPNVDIVGWDCQMIMLNGKSRICGFYATDAVWHNLFHGGFATQRYCIKKSLIYQAGLWNKDVHFWNDIELGARLLKLNPQIIHAGKEITVKIIATAKSITEAGHADLGRMEHSLTLIENTLPNKHAKIWCEQKRIIEAACATRDGSENGYNLYRKIIKRTDSAYLRIIYRFTYHYTRLGGRGAAQLMKPFIS